MPKFMRPAAFVAPVLIALAVLPFVYSNQLLLFNFIVFLILTQGINIIYGFTGYLPFGYVGFFGAGAYGFSLSVMHWQMGAAPALLVGAIVAVLLGVLLAPLLRLSGAYFAIANLAAAMGTFQVISNPSLTDFTRGPYGVALSGVFAPNLAYIAAFAILTATLGIVIYLRCSRFGLALQAIRDDAVTAATAGIDVVRYRILAWLISAMVAGLAGGVFAWYVSVFYAETVFSSTISIFAIVFALFGGVTTVTGPILGVLILYGTYNAIGISTPHYFQLIYGLLIMGLVLFLPNGLVSVFKRWGIDVP